MNIFYLCLKIFFARILDVSLGTIKTIYIVKEKRIVSSIISFFEVFIWFLIAREALNTELNSLLIPIIYSLGYATGTYIGILLSTKLISGNLTIHIISNHLSNKQITNLKNKGFGLTKINNNYLLTEINKKDLNKLKESIFKIDPHAFIIINESKSTYNGYHT